MNTNPYPTGTNPYPTGQYPQQPMQQPGYPPVQPYQGPPSGYPPPGYPQPPMPPVQPQQAPVPPKKRGKGLLIAGIIIVALVLCGAIGSMASKGNAGTKVDTPSANNTGSTSNNSTSNNSTNSQPAPTTQHFKPGDTVKVGDTWEVTISNVRSVPAGQYDSLKSGDMYIGVDVNFKNVSPAEASLYGNADWTLKDTQGQKYDNAYVSDFPNPPDGKVEAGSPAKGSLIFEVPSATHNFQLAYEQSMFSSGQTIWDISVS